MSKPDETREAVLVLHRKSIPIREICRILKINRNTVRRIIRKPNRSKEKKPGRFDEFLSIVSEEFKRCEGNVVRVLENLQCEHGLDIPYSTLTRLVRDMDLRDVQPGNRVGAYNYEPGRESQFDTSPHQVVMKGKKVPAQCAGHVLSYCRHSYIQYYPIFTRFEAKVFLQEAHKFNEGSTETCVVDNTSVVVAHGQGATAAIAPEMEAFGKFFAMRFIPHAVGHADRKALVERLFAYAENNFLKGRTFSGWRDLNQRARQWCVEVANRKYKKALGMTADEAYVVEKRFLRPLPPYLPPVYKTLMRIADMYGYVTVDTNRYSVPERLCGQKVEVHKTWEGISVFFGNRKVAEHERMIDKRDAKSVIKGHHAPYASRILKNSQRWEKGLIGESAVLNDYARELMRRGRGAGNRRLQKLLHLKRTYPAEAFEKAVKTARDYGLYDLTRLENLILSHVAGDFFNLELNEF